MSSDSIQLEWGEFFNPAPLPIPLMRGRDQGLLSPLGKREENLFVAALFVYLLQITLRTEEGYAALAKFLNF